MIDEYAGDLKFKDVIFAIAFGKIEEQFHVKDVYLLYNNRSCVTHNMRNKVMHKSHAPPYTRNRGIQAILKGVDMYFYGHTMRKDIMLFVSSFMACQKIKYN